MTYDLFISYRHADADRVLPLVEALRAAGLAIWIDEREIEDFAGITRSIAEGLANAKALLAWYSAIYPQSRACQWELTAAFLAAQRTGEVRRRLLLMNPEVDNGHIHPVELRDELYQQAPSPGDTEALKKLAQTLKAHVDQLSDLLGDIQPLATPPWYGKKGVGSNRFVGRLPDMWKLHTGLHTGEVAIITGSTAPGVAQISGMGGVGKSLLAEEYALRFGAAFPGGVFWLRAFGNDNAKAGLTPGEREAERTRQFSQMAAWLGVPLQGLTPEEVEGRLTAKLGMEEKPFLWVIDDIPTGMAVDDLQRWFAPHPLGKTLVTTRSREYRTLGTVVPLGVLQPDEAWQLLTFHRRPEGAAEEDAARGLLHDLGNHALAVEVTGAALKTEEGLRSIAAYREALNHLAEDELELAAELADALPSGHEASIAGTLLRSIAMLGPEGEDFLRLASLLAVAPIPTRFVQSVFATVDNLDENSALRRTRSALAQADKLSLAEAAEAGQGMRTVHTLISRTMRFRDHAAGRRELLQQATVQALLTEMPKAADIRSHAELAWAIPHTQKLSSQGDELDTAELLRWLARYEHVSGNYRAAETGFRNELDIRTCIQGNEHPDTLTAMNNLALTLSDQGDLPSARHIQEQVLEAFRRSLGNEHPDTLTAMNNLAQTLSRQGDLPGARDLEEQALEASRRILGNEHPDTLRVMGNLALSLSKQGDLTGARDLEEQALDSSRRILGNKHPYTLTAMNNLAQTLSDQGTLPGARDLQEQVFEAFRRILGNEHPDTLTAMGNLAQTLSKQGDLTGARDLQEQVLKARLRILGNEHPDTLGAMNNLAQTLSKQGDLTGARDLEEQVLEASSRILGNEHPDTTLIAWNLYRMLKELQDMDSASEVFNNHLAWLLQSDPDLLSASQTQIRQMLMEMIIIET